MNARPVLRYHGGKWRIAPWVISFFPEHRVYVEPFGGAGSVLMRKPRSYAEIWNDLDDEVVNLFRVLRSDRATELRRMIELTPYARSEFNTAYEHSPDDLERARRLVVRSFMGHGSSGARKHRTGFRSNTNRLGSTPCGDWCSLPASLDTIIARLRGVIIEQRPFEMIIERNGEPGTLIYCDPPYMFGTRSQKRIGNDLFHGYAHELDDDAHGRLLDLVLSSRAMIVLSGYRSKLYDQRLAGWRRFETNARSDGAHPRVENIWLSPNCEAGQRSLFEGRKLMTELDP